MGSKIGSAGEVAFQATVSCWAEQRFHSHRLDVSHLLLVYLQQRCTTLFGPGAAAEGGDLALGLGGSKNHTTVIGLHSEIFRAKFPNDLFRPKFLFLQPKLLLTFFSHSCS